MTVIRTETIFLLYRYDISRTNKRFIIRALTLQNGTVACLLYFVSLIISLSIAATDDKISLYTRYPDLWKDEQVGVSEVQTCTCIVWPILDYSTHINSIGQQQPIPANVVDCDPTGCSDIKTFTFEILWCEAKMAQDYGINNSDFLWKPTNLGVNLVTYKISTNPVRKDLVYWERGRVVRSKGLIGCD